MKRTGAILFWLGLVIAIIGVAVAIIFGISASRSVSDSFGDSQPMSGGNTTVTMAEEEFRTIYGATPQDTESAQCTVIGPNGESVSVEPASEFTEVSDSPVTEVGSFQSTTAGDYRVECTGGVTLISPGFDLVALGSGFLGVIGGVLGVGLGGLLLILGAVLWFVGRSKAKKATQSQSFGSGGGYNQGGYNQGGYNSPPPPPGANQQPPSTNPYQPGSGSTPPPPPPPSNQ